MQMHTEEIEKLASIYAQRAQRAARQLRAATAADKDGVLRLVAEKLRTPAYREKILAANLKDIQNAETQNLAAALVDRLRLDADRLDGLAQAVDQIIALKDPVGQMSGELTRPNGLRVGKMKAPLGVIFMIYESRPNVTIDAATLCFKASNAVVLRGGKEALHSNTVLARLFKDALKEGNMPEDALVFVETTERTLMSALLRQSGTIDLVIPRGGTGLISAVGEQSKIPVLQHYQGICHVYVHEDADLQKAQSIAINAKTQRPGVCNAMEGLVVDESIAARFMPKVVKALLEAQVELRLCERSLSHLSAELKASVSRASAQDFHTEFLSLDLAIKTVDGFDAAVDFLAEHGSGHTESIITENGRLAQTFLRQVDASCVLHNASTRFNDGGELGLGAELGISTTKLHAYGPMGLNELCTEKYVVVGDGQIRE